MQTNCLDYTLAFFEFKRCVLKCVFRKKPAVGNKTFNILKTKVNVFFANLVVILVFFKYGFFYFLFWSCFIHIDYVICRLVNAVNTAAVLVEDNIVAIHFKCVYHIVVP